MITQQREKFTRRHTLMVLPLPLEPEDSAPDNRAAKRFTMDFSLLSTSSVSESGTHIAAKAVQVDLTECPFLGSEVVCVWEGGWVLARHLFCCGFYPEITSEGER